MTYLTCNATQRLTSFSNRKQNLLAKFSYTMRSECTEQKNTLSTSH
jgi:hypothetical protein